MARKKNGQQKSEMAKKKKKNNLQVSFSKRRATIFKKVNELSTLCGVDIAIVVFSLGNNVYSFGHPCAEKLIEDFIHGNPPQATSDDMMLVEPYRNIMLQELNIHLTQVLNKLDVEKRRSTELNQMQEIGENQCWWMAPKEKLSFSQLKQLKTSLEDLKKKVTKQDENIIMQNALNNPNMMSLD